MTESEALFIDVDVDAEVAADPALAAKLAEVCPVDIFDQDDTGALAITRRNLDECVLCELCMNAAPPGTVRIIKRYEDDAVLERS